MKKYLTLTLVLITVSACAQWGKRIKGNGNVVTIERSVGEYDEVSSAGWFDVELVAGKEGEITLKGESNLLEKLKTEVKNGELIIKTEKGVNLQPSSWKSGITITVPVEEISAVRLSGSGDVVSKTTLKSSDSFRASIAGSGDVTLTIEAENVKASISGSGDMNLDGSAKTLDVSVSGSGDINAYDLEADNVEAQVSGSADLQVTAKEMLRARVSGSGDITYKGNPSKVDTKSSGSGDISSY